MRTVSRQNFLFLGEYIKEHGLNTKEDFLKTAEKHDIHYDSFPELMDFAFDFLSGVVNKDEHTLIAYKGAGASKHFRNIPITSASLARYVNSFNDTLDFDDDMALYYLLVGTGLDHKPSTHTQRFLRSA